MKTYGYNDCFIEHGKAEELEEKYGLNVRGIINNLKKDVKVLKRT